VVGLNKPIRIRIFRERGRRDFLLDFKHAVKKKPTEWKKGSSFDNAGQIDSIDYVRGLPCTVTVQGEPAELHVL
jgi:hypothetical protein